MGKSPHINVRNRQQKIPVNVTDLQIFAGKALHRCLQLRKRKPTDLDKLHEVFVWLISDRRMASLHRKFMHQTGPTDVLTFQHGEIFISVETAKRHVRAFGNSAQSKDTGGTTHVSGETGSVTTAEPTKETRSEEDLDVPWQVVVHNDPVNLMSYVTMVFQRVFGYPREKADKHMLEVHQKGRSILWAGMREPAELYVQQLHGYLLLATLEKLS